MPLNYKELGSGRPLIILHGLFGSLDNWATLGRKFAEDYWVFLIDQRNHGQSPHSDEFSYEAMASDLLDFIDQHALTDAVVMGHSMGGKTAMVAALDQPEKIERLIVVDMAPKSYEVHHRTILDGLLSLDFDKISSRSEADAQLARYVPEESTRQFLLKSLYRKENDQFALRFNLPVINREIESISSWNARSDQYDRPAFFIRGGQSDYVDPDDASIEVNFPNARLVTVENAGHWVHAQAPVELSRLVRDFAS